MKTLLDFLSGKKTYLVAAGAIAYLVGSDLRWWPLNTEVLGIFGSLGLITIRAGIAKTQNPQP
jgi:hypothetical protein